MSENGLRKGTREKKPSRFHYYEDAEYNLVPAARTNEPRAIAPQPKEKPTTPLEINQIAKLFCKFINTANQRTRDHDHTQQAQQPQELSELPRELQSISAPPNKKNDLHNARDLSNEPKNQRSRELGELTNKDQKGTGRESKSRNAKNGKSANNIAASLQPDLNYHNALNQHVKNTYPNINSLSADMLRELSIPTEMLQKQASRTKPKEEKKPGILPREESKPFKHQSYHIAIAYHIYLKQVNISQSPDSVDPTMASRKLRQRTQKYG